MHCEGCQRSRGRVWGRDREATRFHATGCRSRSRRPRRCDGIRRALRWPSPAPALASNRPPRRRSVVGGGTFRSASRYPAGVSRHVPVAPAVERRLQPAGRYRPGSRLFICAAPPHPDPPRSTNPARGRPPTGPSPGSRMAAADNGAFAALLGRSCPRRILRYVCGNCSLAPCDCTVLGGLIAQKRCLVGVTPRRILRPLPLAVHLPHPRRPHRRRGVREIRTGHP